MLALSVAFAGVALVAEAPTASACTSDPDIVCGVIWVLQECGDDLNHKTLVERCTP